MAKLVSWQRYYTRFWKQSMLFCNNRWPDFLNVNSPDQLGATGVIEPEYVKAVTGQDISFADGIERGRKIWNLDHAIWTLQGRHRDMVHFVENIYERLPSVSVDAGLPDVHMPGKENGTWGFYGYSQHTLDRWTATDSTNSKRGSTIAGFGARPNLEPDDRVAAGFRPDLPVYLARSQRG